MDREEMAKIVATQRVMGSKLSAKEIIDAYQRAYSDALAEIREAYPIGKATTVKRPF